MGNNDLGLLDILTILGFGLNIENYRLNIKQNKKLLDEMSGNQDKMLLEIIAQNKTIIKQNEEIIDFLKQIKK